MFEFVKPGLPLLPKYPLNLELKILSKINSKVGLEKSLTGWEGMAVY